MSIVLSIEVVGVNRNKKPCIYLPVLFILLNPAKIQQTRELRHNTDFFRVSIASLPKSSIDLLDGVPPVPARQV